MSTAVVPYAQLTQMAQAFAASGMFGTKSAEQTLSLLLIAQADGVHPATAMRDYDIIQGRPAKKAAAIQRAFLEAGGKIEWHERGDTKSDATFSHPSGGSVRVTWDMERAKKAGIGSKDMYGKYGRQMLSARCISEGCRTVYPAATSGLYTPEEVREFKDKRPQERNMGTAQVVQPDEDVTLQIPGQAPDQAAAPQATPPSTEAPSPRSVPAGAASISAESVAELRRRFGECDKGAEAAFLKIAKVAELEDLAATMEGGADTFVEACDWIERRKKRFAKDA